MQRGSQERSGGEPAYRGPQLPFELRRPGESRVGRPPKRGAGLRHGKREPLDPQFPIHLRLTLVDGLPSLRSKAAYEVLLSCFAEARNRFGMRLNHFLVQRKQLDLIVEVRNRRALSRGMSGVTIRVARGLNRLWERDGSVFADRYHERVLRTPLEVRGALEFVLGDARAQRYNSAAWFDGWKDGEAADLPRPRPRPVDPARTTLQTTGWRRHGLISSKSD